MRARRLWSTAIATSILLGSAVVAADGVPWRERRRPDVSPNRISAERVDPDDWPPEPASPSDIDRDRLGEALHQLCGWLRPSRRTQYADWVLKYADEFDVDPFLLGALIHRMGRCQSDAEALSGYGLTLISPRMHWTHLDDGKYEYWLRKGGEWVKKEQAMDRFPFGGPRLKRPEENLYFAAGLLAMWKKQHPVVDYAFEQEPHRHYVSHFVWGDRVPSDRAEDRVLLDRRRLLLYYGAIERRPPVEKRGLELGAPLDAAPRVISSFIGASRSGGNRNHRGVDVEGDFREPVRAVADGMVNFAGVDLPGSRNNENMEPEEIAEVSDERMGRGGRFVCVLHHPPEGSDAPDWMRSCYMHLEDVEVSYGEQVKRGDRIGTVGRTGMKHSAAHLHFEMHGPDGLLDPSEVLDGLLVGHEVDPEDVDMD